MVLARGADNVFFRKPRKVAAKPRIRQRQRETIVYYLLYDHLRSVMHVRRRTVAAGRDRLKARSSNTQAGTGSCRIRDRGRSVG